jgi:hypothetical protein
MIATTEFSAQVDTDDSCRHEPLPPHRSPATGSHALASIPDVQDETMLTGVTAQVVPQPAAYSTLDNDPCS